ncbi:hypothetical protein RV10_GL003592 [Enterococcus pallens]|nr:hypothetical protein RV10_GL003592 [Enterococcus pallens]
MKKSFFKKLKKKFGKLSTFFSKNKLLVILLNLLNHRSTL